MFAVPYPLPASVPVERDDGDGKAAHGRQDDGCADHDAAAAALRDTLDGLKVRVREFCETVGHDAWRQLAHVDAHRGWPTSVAHPASRSYYKLYELLRACALPQPARALCLCEAPGGFAQAVVEYAPGARVRAVSRASGPAWGAALRALRGVELHSADVLDAASLQALVDASTDESGVGQMTLVTADGGDDFDHDRLEQAAAPLLQAQVDVALPALAPGGHFVLKLFGCAEAASIHLLARLCASFEYASLFKPTYSRPTNSEVYVVCSGFRADAGAKHLPDAEWLRRARAQIREVQAEQARALGAAFDRHAQRQRAKAQRRRR